MEILKTSHQKRWIFNGLGDLLKYNIEIVKAFT